MNKLLKILFISLLVFTFSYICTYASSDDEASDVTQETPSSGLSSLYSSDYSTNVSPLNSYAEANLELNNILCVILIAVGVVIILLAIAILIRLKR